MSKIINDISELTSNMQSKITAFLSECEKEGLDCHVFESYRSQERQNELYAQGRTKPGNIVTWTTSSRHTQREAVDMAFGGPGKWHWNGDWDKMRNIASRYGLESLYPRESAHLQDDGTIFNQETMELSKRDYTDIFEKNFSDKVLADWEGEDIMSEGQIKALLDIYGQKLIRSDIFKQFVIDIIKEELTN